jgi:anaerobic ribonucleoside-triphosphate reductase
MTTDIDISPVRTSDGHLVPFDRQKITDSLIYETAIVGCPIPLETAKKVAAGVERRIKKLELSFLSGALIREMVCAYMLDKGMIEWRNAYARVGMSLADAIMIDRGEGFEARENANLPSGSPESPAKKKSDKISKEQNLLRLPPHIAEAHLRGDIHVHDLEYLFQRVFCQDYDLRYFFAAGMAADGTGLQTSFASHARRAEVAILHAVKVLAAGQTNCAGGQGLYNFLTFIAPYLKDLEYDDIKQLMQMVVYELTQVLVARGGQTVFSSLQLSPGVPEIWRDVPIVYKGKLWDGEKNPRITYGQFEREVRLAFKAVMEIMKAGDARGRPFSFPKPEILIDVQFIDPDIWDKPLTKKDDVGVAVALYYIYEQGEKITDELTKTIDQAMTRVVAPSYKDLYHLAFLNAAINGTPYFESHLHDKSGGVKCAQCCAYFFQSGPDADPEFHEKLNFIGGKHFSMGGWQVVTLNCPRAAYMAEGDYGKLVAILKSWIDLAVEVFKIKHNRVLDLARLGKMTFLTQQLTDGDGNRMPPLVDLESLSYTVGIVGVNEMAEAMTGKALHESEDAWKLAVKAMTELQIYVHELSKKHGITIAFARTPAETVAQRFAVCDLIDESFREKARMHVKGDVGASLREIDKTRDLPVEYTNGAQVPVDALIRIEEKVRRESVFFGTFDGGNILNLFMAAFDPRLMVLINQHDSRTEHAIHSIVDDIMARMLDLIRKYPVKYFTLTQDLCICMDCNKTAIGIHTECPFCGSVQIDTLSRITGYLQSTRGWNRAKKEELKQRHRYTAESLIGG